LSNEGIVFAFDESKLSKEDRKQFPDIKNQIEPDGLPPIGVKLTMGQPYYSCINTASGEMKIIKFKGSEDAFVDCVRLVGNDTGTDIRNKVYITMRVTRNPVVGDKFANRHGQKGVCSMRYPAEDMPFTESGMIPDITFNPHGFPSRMTIGMIIECMAGKSAATHGIDHDATPFTFHEDDPAIEHYGELLKKAGFNYYGSERMYSGTDGREMEADIFFGVIYYQRLRHMVGDKYQVRSTGPVDIITKQPVKGRKRGGGIRFGEMERDSLIAHGTSFLLQDRLFHCSDGTLEHMCTKCGSILSPVLKVKSGDKFDQPEWTCNACDTRDHIELVAIPAVFKYFVCEMAAINVKVVLHATKP